MTIAKATQAILAAQSTAIYDIAAGGTNFPCTVTFYSVNAGRKIEISVTNGTYYYEPELDITATNYIAVTLNNPVTHIKVTGSVGDSLLVIDQK